MGWSPSADRRDIEHAREGAGRGAEDIDRVAWLRNDCPANHQHLTNAKL
jgi:hypothetical protein